VNSSVSIIGVGQIAGDAASAVAVVLKVEAVPVPEHSSPAPAQTRPPRGDNQ